VHARFKQIHPAGHVPLAAARGVQKKAGVQMSARCRQHADGSQVIPRRQATAGHDKFGRFCCHPQLVEASRLVCERQPRPGKDESVLLAGTALVDSEALTRRLRDRNLSK
jgi:hypothetical protein